MTTIERLAEQVGTHPLLSLVVVSVLLLAAVWAAWQLTERFGPPVWNWLASHARRLAFLPSSVTTPVLALRAAGIHALVSVAVCLIACLAFAEIVEEIGADEDLGAFDLALSDSLRRNASPAVLQAFAAITHLGDVAVLTGLAVLVAAVLLWRRRWFLALIWSAVTAGGALLNPVIKEVFARARPVHTHGVVLEQGWSFPSGHAAGSFIVYGLLGYLIARHAPRPWRLPIALATLLVVVFVGSSRIVLHVHYFSDVLAGYAFGAAWLGAWIAGLELRRRLLEPAL